MGETMEAGKLVAWLVEPGVPFKRGQEILEVETDKTVVEFPALGDGVITETLVEIGELRDVGTPIARVDVGEGPDWTDDSGRDVSTPSEAGERPEAMPPAPNVEKAPTGGPVRATPRARRVAKAAGIALTGIEGTGRRGRIERRDVEAVARMTRETREVGGLTCLEKGPATGVPVAFLHGFGADHLAWGGVQSNLARSGRRTLSFDLPGHGTTRLGATSIHDLPGPVARALTELGTGPVHLVAHSMGAIVAVQLADMVEVRSLTLIAPTGLGHSIDVKFLRGLAGAEAPGEIAHLLERVTEGPHGLSDAMITDIHRAVAERRLTGLVESLVGGSGQAVSIRAALSRLAERKPVHMILGHRDRIIDWREALDVSSRIAIHHLPRVGHTPHWEAMPEVLAILEEVTR